MLCPKCIRNSDRIVRGYCNSCYTMMLKNGTIKPRERVPDNLTELQKQIIDGLMLGDGCIHISDKQHSKLCRLTVTRKNTDKAYLEWQFLNLKEFYSSPPKEYTTFDKRTNKNYYSCYLNSRVSQVFSNYRKKWYRNNKKIVPEDLVLTPLTIAIWFCDDGCICHNKRGKSSLIIKFSTNGFSKDDVNFLAKLLSFKYNEYFGVHNNGNGFIIKAAHGACLKIISDIEDLIPESMFRKKTWKRS